MLSIRNSSTTFGSSMPDSLLYRSNYSFGYQGSDIDPDISEIGVTYFITRFRLGNANTGQWLSVDFIKPNLGESPYSTMSRNPILLNDIHGDSVWLYSTTLPGASTYLKPLTHTFIVVKTSDGVLHYYVYGPDNDNAPLGGSPMVRKSWGSGLNGGYDQDKEIIKGKDKEHLKNKFLIDIPEGMNQDEFDQKVIQVAESYGNNPGIKYNAATADQTTGNCNTSTSTILQKSGVTKDKISEIDDEMEGNNWGFEELRPWTEYEQKQAVAQKKVAQEIEKKYPTPKF